MVAFLNFPSAFCELDKKEEFCKLSGHSGGQALCFVINPDSSATIQYGNNRANLISSKFISKSKPQDLLHIFNILKDKDGESASLKIVERIGKLNKFGQEEISSLKKMCKWSKPTLVKFIEVLNMYEHYETQGIYCCQTATITSLIVSKLLK